MSPNKADDHSSCGNTAVLHVGRAYAFQLWVVVAHTSAEREREEDFVDVVALSMAKISMPKIGE